jgi:hypothetical protein
MSSNNNNNAGSTTEKVQDAANAVYNSTAEYAQQTGDTVKASVNGAREYVANAVAPPKSPTAGEKLEEGAKDAKQAVENAAHDASDKINKAVDNNKNN